MQNSTLINFINDEIKSIASERLSPITLQDVPWTSPANSDTESDCSEEIPIYINNFPRYISNLNKFTTCNDIIKALIDDELANEKVSKQAICDPQHYTIYERFRNIEHPLEGDENIYEIWLNWGENRDQVQFKLKLNKEYCETKDQHQHIKNKKFRKNGIKKLIKKVLKQGTEIQKRLVEINERRLESECSEYQMVQCEKNSSLPSSLKWDNEPNETVTENDDEDELFLIIDHHNDNDSGVSGFSKKDQKFYSKVADDEFHCFRRTPNRKFYRDRDHHVLADKFSSHYNFAKTSCKFEMVHKDLRSKMDSVQEIIDKEKSLLTKIHCNSPNKLISRSFDNSEIFTNSISEIYDNNQTVIV